MVANLKECPWCGGEVVAVEVESKQGVLIPKCTKCGSTNGKGYRTIESLEEAWNKRDTEDRLIEANAKLTAVLDSVTGDTLTAIGNYKACTDNLNSFVESLLNLRAGLQSEA